MCIKRYVSLRIFILILPVFVQEFQSVASLHPNGDAYQASSSLLKLSHHDLSPVWHKQKQNQTKPVVQAEHREVSNEVIQSKKRNKGSKSIQETNQAAKKSKLKFFMNQSKKIALTSILPNRSKQTSQNNATGSHSVNNDNNNRINHQIDTPSTITGDESFPFLNELPNVFSDPFLTNGLPSQHIVPYPPHRLNNQNQPNILLDPSQSTTHHFIMSQGSPGLLSSHHPSYSANFNHNHQPASHDQQRFHQNFHFPNQLPAINALAQMFNSNRNLPSHAHGRLISRPENSAQEMFVADQSIENHHKIRLSKLEPNEISLRGAEMPATILASSTPSAVGDNQQVNNHLNKTMSNSLIRAAAQQKQQQVSQGNAASVVASALTSAAAAAILTERAKTLIGQLNQQTNNSSKSGITNIRNNREVTTALSAAGSSEMRQKVNNSSNNSNNINDNSNNNLSSLIKNAAEAWATSNGAPLAASAQTVAGSSSNGVGGIVDSTPTIIVEHDGPTVTTLDFDGPRQQPAVDDEEDDVSSTFFSENDEAEQEEGSHEAKRSLKPRMYHHNRNPANFDTSRQYSPNVSHNRHPTHSSSMQTQALRHPDFDSHLDHRHHQHQHQYQHHHQMNPQHQPSDRGPSAPSASEFFEERGGEQANDLRQNAGEPDQFAHHNDRYRYNRHESTPPSNDWQSRSRRPKDGPYPDSINAIKDQGSDSFNGPPAPPSPSGLADRKEKSFPSTNDPIETLIKDLQELHKKRNDDTSSFTDEELGRAKGMMKSSSDDYEDILGSGRDETGQHRDQLDQENEKTRLLRKKLLNRLLSKHERKKGNGDGSVGKGNSFDNDSIRIPLHALLLAALDRRMSPSELKSQSVAQDNLINDDRNKNIILQGGRDFSEATANLGSLINGNNLFEHLANLNSVQRMEDSLKPLNLANISNESLTPAGMLLIENLSSFDAVNQRRIPALDHQSGTDVQRDIYDQSSAATTRTPSSTTSSPIPTTAASISSTTSTTTAAPLQPSSAPTPLGDKRTQPSYGNHRDASSTRPDIRYTSKGRRAIENEGDFDLDKQVNEYENDQYDRSLEPSWMKSSRNKNRKSDGASAGVEFDDEFNEIDRQTRRKILNHRAKPRSRPRKQNTEADYVANEQRFFNNLKKDTSADINDVDHTIRSIENSIPDEKQEAKSRRRAEQVDREDEEDREDDCSRQGCDDSNGDEKEDDEEHNGEIPNARNRRYPLPGRGSKKRNSAASKAGEVDAEIRRIEDDTRRRKASQRAELDSRDDGSGSDDSESNGDGVGGDEGESESRHRRTTVQPDGVISMVLNPSGNGTHIYSLKQQRFN